MPASATPYPSVKYVSGLTGIVDSVTVSLKKLSHTGPDDIIAVLRSPTGRTCVLMANCGGTNTITNVDLVFDDAAADSLPDATLISSGSYKPTAYSPFIALNAPGPQAPYGTTLSVFDGDTPNGSWSLWVIDDQSLDSGIIALGWDLTITTANFVDNGNDPIEGPPKPPGNHQLFANPTAPRLTWTIPDVLINAAIDSGTPNVIITLTNYTWPAWAIGIPYIINQRVSYNNQIYYSLQDANTGHLPDEVGSLWWAVDDTLFNLWAKATRANADPNVSVGTSSYAVISDSLSGGNFWAEYEPPPLNPSPKFDLKFTDADDPADRRPVTYYFYITATKGGITVSSNTLAATLSL